jgi:hypothetical protein
MDITKMLDELRAERDGVDQAIMVLERLAVGHGKRRGRPPAWMSDMKTAASDSVAKRRGRPPGSKNKIREETTDSVSRLHVN